MNVGSFASSRSVLAPGQFAGGDPAGLGEFAYVSVRKVPARMAPIHAAPTVTAKIFAFADDPNGFRVFVKAPMPCV